MNRQALSAGKLRTSVCALSFWILACALPFDAMAYRLITPPDPTTLPLVKEERDRLTAPIEGTDTAMNADDLRHLLERTGFGVDQMMLSLLEGKSRHEAADFLIDGLSFEPETAAPEFAQHPTPDYWHGSRLPEEARQIFRKSRQGEMLAMRLHWLGEMARSSSPFTEKLTLFWHDHFVTSYADVPWPHVLLRQLSTLRRYGSGNFEDLLRAMVRDPALLAFLDNNDSRPSRVNENFGRELLELMTLGEGHYSQADVIAAANALSGYSFLPMNGYRFAFRNWAAVNEPQKFLGTEIDDADDLIDVVLEQERTAQFIATKFWQFFISDLEQDEKTISQMADVFRSSGYDVRSLLAATLKSTAFWDQRYRLTSVKTPIELVIGSLRRTGTQLPGHAVIGALNRLGQLPFDQADVGGWPEGVAWLTPARIALRERLIRRLQKRARTHSNDGFQNEAERPQTAKRHHKGELVIAMSGTAFEGPPAYRVEIEKQGVWRPILEGRMSDALDTGVHGSPTNPERELPIEEVTFDLRDIREGAKALRVLFTNDHANNQGDRNIWVRHLRTNNRIIDASAAITTSCADGNPRSGALYCNGSVEFDLTSALAPIPQSKPPSPKDLSVRDIFVSWASNVRPKGERGRIAVTLDQPRLGNRSWDGITIDLIVADWIGGFGVELSSRNCWPDCLTKWPDGAEFDEITGNRAIFATMALDGSLVPSASGFEPEDRALLKVLLANLPVIIDAIGNDPAFPRPRRQEAWVALLEPYNAKLQRNRVRAGKIRMRHHERVGSAVYVQSSATPSMAMASMTLGDRWIGAQSEMSIKDHPDMLALSVGELAAPKDVRDFWKVMLESGYQLK